MDGFDTLAVIIPRLSTAISLSGDRNLSKKSELTNIKNTEDNGTTNSITGKTQTPQANGGFMYH
ncbi:MAG TPA: hypothetical protein GXX19_01210 [Syntrophomonadaceae bacterium]|nr:hypothetical protein [Syntrophomonadaceae bacterium]